QKDILGWMREQRRELFERLEYSMIEPSARRKQWQAQTLSEFEGKVRWARFSGLPAPLTPPSTVSPCLLPGVRGIIFSNELLDALPVHRLGWDARQSRWFEWGVAVA